MQLKDIFSASSDGVSQPSNSSLRFKQKALAASILAALAIIAFIAVEASDTKPARKAPPEAAMITLRPDGTDKDVLIARYDANFLALSRRIEEVQREAAATETRLRAIIADQKSRLETQTSEVKDLKAIAGRAGLTPRPGETPEETEARIKSLLKANDDAAYISKLSSQFGSKTPGKVFHTDPARNTNEPASSIVPALPDTPLQVNRAAGTTVEDYLPAGSFVRGRLLTGVYASTGAGAASQPLPMVIRLEDTAVLPNAWRSQVTACHVTASATGDLSSERAFVRLDRLSCVGKKGEALDVRVSGYAVGEDGKVGVRGKLVTRSGQAIASALSVGLLSGLGESITRSSEEVTTSITGTQSKRYKNAWMSGMGEGLSDSMDRITDYYLRLADRIFPVLEVDAGRPVDLVFSQGVLLADPSKR